MDDTDAFLL
jgi:hypothetical protein